MDVRFKAIRKTLGQLTIIFIAATLVVYFSTYFSSETLVNIFLISIVSIGAWMMYNANLVDMKFEEKYSKLKDKSNETT